jgi:hypothetical protein
MASTTTDRIKGGAKYAIGFGLLAFVVWRNWDPNEQTKSPGLSGLLRQSPDWLMLAAVVLLQTATIGLQFTRWYVLVRAVDLPFTKLNALRLGLVGYFYNLFLPGSIAGDFVKAYFIARDLPSRKTAAVATVVIDRFFGLFGLLLFAALCGGIAWANGNELIAGNEYLRKIITVSIGCVIAAAIGWVALGLLPKRWSNAIEAKLHRLPKVGKSLAEVWYAVRLYRERPLAVYLCIGISALSHTCMQLMLHCATRAFPSLAADAGSLAEHFVIGPIGFIAQVLPLSPGGVGIAEAIFGYLYTILNRLETTGVVGRLTIRAAEYGLGMVGYLTYLRMRTELPAEEPARPA